jgi:hypothetical protein
LFPRSLSLSQAGLPVELGVNYSALRFMKATGAVTEAEAAPLEEGAIPPRYLPASKQAPLQ